MEENPSEKAKYGYDLIHAAEERYRLKELEKLKVKQQEIQVKCLFISYISSTCGCSVGEV